MTILGDFQRTAGVVKHNLALYERQLGLVVAEPPEESPLRLGRNDAALVRLAVSVTDSDEEAERRAVSLVRGLVPYL